MIGRNEEIVSAFEGQNSSLPHATLKVSEAEEVLNFVIKDAKLRKIWGAELYATIENESGPLKWIDSYKNRWIVQRGSGIYYEDAEGSATFTKIGDISNSTTSRIRSEKAKQNIYMVNGREVLVYGEVFPGALGITKKKLRPLGLIPPGLGLRGGNLNSQKEISLTQSNGGSFVDATTYQYLFTYISLTGPGEYIESLPNGAQVLEDGTWGGRNSAEITMNAGTRKVTIDLSAFISDYDPEVVDGIVIYRRKMTGAGTGVAETDWKRISTYPVVENDPDNPLVVSIGFNSPPSIGSYGYEDLGDYSGVVLDESNSPPPTGRYYNTGGPNDESEYGPIFIKEFNDQLWLFGSQYPGINQEEDGTVFNVLKASDGIAHASSVGQYNYWQYTYTVGSGQNQKPTGMAKFRNALFFLKERSIFYIDGANPNSYQVRQVPTERGVIAPGSVQETPAGIIGLSADGFILINSTGEPEQIGQKIFDVCEQINFDALYLSHSTYDVKECKYECHIPVRGSSNVNLVCSYDINQKTWSFFDKRVGASSQYAIDSNGKRIGLLGDKNNGRMYNIVNENITTFNGEKIFGKWASKHFDFGAPTKNKALRLLKIKGRAKRDFSIEVDIIMDFGQKISYTLNQDSNSVYSLYAESSTDSDGAEYDVDQFSQDTVPVKFEMIATGIARNFQIVIRESGNSDTNNAMFEIEEICLSADVMGR